MLNFIFNKKKNVSKILNDINLNGWHFIENHNKALILLAEQICEIKNLNINSTLKQNLIPKEIESTKIHSLSSSFGLNPFPLHSDGTHLSKPPRFIILRSKSANETRTLLSDGFKLRENTNWEEYKNSLWEIKTIDKGIIQTKLFNIDIDTEKEFIRYNNLSMKCIEGDKFAIYKAVHSLPIHAIKWNKNTTIIIDNWRMLHGREKIKDIDCKSRVIERLQVFT